MMDTETILTLIIVSSVWSGIVGAIIGKPRNANAVGFWLGVIFGPLGAIATFAYDKRPQCPKCNGRLDGTPELCPHCRSKIGKQAVKPEEETATVQFPCQSCRKILVWPASDAGNKIVCEHCGELAKVPSKPSDTSKKLRTCPECNRQVSRQAESCPQCGCEFT